MDYKLKGLFDKVYRGFIRGEFGGPKIPNRNEVMNKILEITTLDPVPLIANEKMDDIDINEISSQFSKAIDDIDILFGAIEDESSEILEQLTNSLKEHNGVKRELRRINSRADDISTGKLGEEYLTYDFTENFNNLSNINSFRSDPVDLEAGAFTIKRNSSKVLSLEHYRGTKLEFNVIQNFSRLVEYGYTGASDAAVILDPNDSRDLQYRIKTSAPGPLRVATSIQLTPDASPININSVSISVDSRTTQGQIRLYIRKKDSLWHDVKPISIKDIKGDRISFTFDTVSTSHIKLEFSKSLPDIPGSNEYLFTVRSLTISSSDSFLQSTLISNPIDLESYSEEIPIIDNIRVTGDLEVPPGTNAEVYVAEDIKISGRFLDVDNNRVFADSPNINSFDVNGSGFEFLSDLLAVAPNVSGAGIFAGQDFVWKQVEVSDEDGGTIPQVLTFNKSALTESINNSIFQRGAPKYLFGDSRYTGPWPPSYYGGGEPFISGWCNDSNPLWSGTLAGMVVSGILVSGVDVAALVGVAPTGIQDNEGVLHPLISGHPLYSGQWLGYGSGQGFVFSQIVNNSIIKFGEYDKAINGWWRPSSEAITISGFKRGYAADDGSLNEAFTSLVPDFYFNGINFWKIFKFGSNQNVINPSVKLFTYQERPTFGLSGYYPHNFTWKYRSKWDLKSGTKTELTDQPQPTTFDGYTINISNILDTNEELIFDGISEIRLHNTNVVLTRSDYILTPASSTPTAIDLTPLVANRPNLTPQGASFDVTYSFKLRNRYLSTWTGFAIVSSSATNPIITIPSVDVFNKVGVPVISKVDVENLDDGTITTIEATNDLFTIAFDISDNDAAEKHYKITIFCASDEETGFSAKVAGQINWVPYQDRVRKTINVSPGIKLVSNLKPLNIVDLGSLVYDSAIVDSRKAAIFEALNNEKFVVVRQPSKSTFPGYFFDTLEKQYKDFRFSRIQNRGHWIRDTFVNNASGIVTYTTGSSGVNPGKIYNVPEYALNGKLDTTWNNGSCVSKYPNSSGGMFFPVHSTFGYPINVDDVETHTKSRTLSTDDVDPRAPTVEQGYIGTSAHDIWLSGNYNSDWVTMNNHENQTGIKFYTIEEAPNKGFLFYNTAENLPTYYSISYKTISVNDKSNNRFLYKIKLTSDNKSKLIPSVKSLRFIINGDI